jgi:hypothetical protein
LQRTRRSGLFPGLFPAIKDIRVKQHIVEGEYVATVFDFDTTFGVIPVFDCFRVRTESLSKYDHSMIPVQSRIHRNRNGGKVAYCHAAQ